MIEESINSLTKAVQDLTTAITAFARGTPAIPSATAETPAEPKKTRGKAKADPAPETPTTDAAPTRADVSKVAQQVLDAGQIDGLRATYKALGFAKLDEAPVDKYPAIIEALKALLVGASAPTPEPAKAEAPVTAAPTVTLEQVVAAAIALRDSGNTAALKEINSKFGVKKISELAPDKYAEALAALTAAANSDV
jgi:hypothetical protein